MKYLAFLLLLSSCAYGEPVWHGDRAFTAGERAKIEQANAYMAARVGQIPYEIVWDGDHPWAGNACPRDYSIVKGGKAGPGRGYYTSRDHCIYLNENLSPFEGAAAHEIGHSRGLIHLREDQEGIMNPFTGPMIWTENDQASCEFLQICQR